MAPRDLAAGRRMSDVEALMWNVEKDPHLSASIASLSVLDRIPDPDRLRERLESAVAGILRLRQHVVPGFGRLAPPEWRVDPEFDLDWHIRRMRVPGDGSHRELLDLAADLVTRPFDRTRPLWEFTVIEGLEGGRAAMLQKLHHTITDGEGGIRMSEQFIDLERDAAEPLATVTPIAAEPEPHGPLDGMLDAVGHNVRRGLGVGGRVLGGAGELLRSPGRIVGLGADTVGFARSAARQLAVTGTSRSPLWRQRSLGRRFETLQVDFDAAHRAAKALGGSINDFFVVGVASAAVEYHRARGAELDELRIAMPVSTRTSGSSGGNAFSPARVVIPVGEDDPKARFAAISERLSETKGERAISAAGSLAGLVNLLPTSLVVGLARQQVETVDLTTSNVRAAPVPLYIAGALIEANYPMGPTGGTACNVTVMSYDGHLDVGLNVDTGAVDAPEELRERVERAYAELIELA